MEQEAAEGTELAGALCYLGFFLFRENDRKHNPAIRAWPGSARVSGERY
jgi:hypothetical protein